MKDNYRKKSRPQIDLRVTSKGPLPQVRRSLDQGCYVVFDIETTGGNPEKNGITEICALKYSGAQVVGKFYSLVNPKIRIPPIVRKMTGIDNKMLRHAPLIDDIMPQFIDFVGDWILVSHNTIGDLKFLRYFSKTVTGRDLDNYYLCTHLLSEKLVKKAPKKSLGGLAEFLNLDGGDCHRAEADAVMTLDLFKIELERLKKRGITSIERAIRFQGDYESNVRLGWQFPADIMNEAPDGPGVFFLKDHSGKVLLVASCRSIKRELKAFNKIEKLAKPVFKTLLDCDHVEYAACPSLLEAGLREAREYRQHKEPLDPFVYHNRYFNYVNLARVGRSRLCIGISGLQEGTFAAFGPITNGKFVGDALKGIMREMGAEYSKKFYHFSEDDLSAQACLEFFTPGGPAKPRFHFFKRLLGLLKEGVHDEWLKNKTWTTSMGDYNHESGLILIPEGEDSVRLYVYAAGRLAGRGKRRGHWRQAYEEVMAHGRLEPRLQNHLKLGKWYQRLTEMEKKNRHRPLSAAEAHQGNFLLWWLKSGYKHDKAAVLSKPRLVGE